MPRSKRAREKDEISSSYNKLSSANSTPFWDESDEQIQVLRKALDELMSVQATVRKQQVGNTRPAPTSPSHPLPAHALAPCGEVLHPIYAQHSQPLLSIATLHFSSALASPHCLGRSIRRLTLRTRRSRRVKCGPAPSWHSSRCRHPPYPLSDPPIPAFFMRAVAVRPPVGSPPSPHSTGAAVPSR